MSRVSQEIQHGFSPCRCERTPASACLWYRFNLLSPENSEISKENDYLTICILLTDALDSMNNKQAIQLADKILKKQKDLHCAKVTVTLIFKQQTLIPAIAL